MCQLPNPSAAILDAAVDQYGSRMLSGARPSSRQGKRQVPSASVTRIGVLPACHWYRLAQQVILGPIH